MLCRRTLIAFALAAWAKPGLAGEGAAAALAPEFDRIRRRGRLIVAMAGIELPGFIMSGINGRLIGHDVELAEGMAKAMGLPLELNRTAATAEGIIDLVVRGEVDFGLSKVSATLERAMRVRFSRPYLTLHQALLLNRPRFALTGQGRDPIDAAGDPNAVLAVVAGTAYRFYAERRFPRAQLREYASWEAGPIEAVRNGEVLAAYGDELEVMRTLNSRHDAPLYLRATILPNSQDPIAIAVPWNSTQLLAWIDFYLETAAKPLTLDELLSK